MSKKRRRDQPAVDTQLVAIYEDLANIDEEIRLKAAHSLLTRFVAGGTPSADQLNEILRRLIRGLCSGRKAARLGFSVALTEFLRIVFGPKKDSVSAFLDIAELPKNLVDLTGVSGDASGQEDRDCRFGRLFGAESIIKSRIIFQSDLNIHLWSEILDVIYELAEQKSWLRKECGFVLYKAILAVRGMHSKFAQMIIDKLYDYNLSKTPEGIAIWITTRIEDSELTFPSSVWKHDSPLDKEETHSLARILKTGALENAPDRDEMAQKTPQQSVWSTKMHFVWDIIIARLLSGDEENAQTNSKKISTMSFGDFWEECVDKSLFSSASSAERKFWGFQLFQRVVGIAPPSQISSLFTQNFMRCLVNQLKSSDRFLHRAAEKSIDSMVEKAASTPGSRSSILKALLTKPYGDISFDKTTKTKATEALLSQTNESDCEPVMNLFTKLILNPGVQDEKSASSRRLALADQLVAASKGRRMKEDIGGNKSKDPVTLSILKILAMVAYFDLTGSNVAKDAELNPAVSESLRQDFRTRISSCLGHLISKLPDPSIYFYSVVSTVRGNGDTTSFGRPLLEIDESISKVITAALQVLDDAYATSTVDPSPGESKRSHFHSIVLLYSLTLLQMYNEDADAISILEELNNVFEGHLHDQNDSKSSAALVEILLSFSSRPSQLLRRVAQWVFTSIAPGIDDKGLESLTKVLATRENLAGQEEMFSQDNEDEQIESSENSDVEEASAAESESTASASQDDELAAFDAKLAQALGTRPGSEVLKANDDDSSSDEDMNDEQMEALDEQLAVVFRERKQLASKRTEKKDARENIINFKCRVLELLEIYIKQQHKDLLALKSLLLPVLTVIRTTRSPLVSKKASEIMREYGQWCKKHGFPGPVIEQDVEWVLDLLRQVHLEGGEPGASNAHTSACGQAGLLIAKVLVAKDSDRTRLRKVEEVYAETKASGKVKDLFFIPWLDWSKTAKK